MERSTDWMYEAEEEHIEPKHVRPMEGSQVPVSLYVRESNIILSARKNC
jgi:hypothetical protein